MGKFFEALSRLSRLSIVIKSLEHAKIAHKIDIIKYI